MLGASLREMSAGRQGLWIVGLHLEFAGISLLLIAQHSRPKGHMLPESHEHAFLSRTFFPGNREHLF